MSGAQYVRYLMTATLFTDKGSYIVVWDRSDYVMDAETQLYNTKVYKNISESKNLIPKLKEL